MILRKETETYKDIEEYFYNDIRIRMNDTP